MGWAVLANQFLAGLHPDLELKGKLAGQEGTFDQLLATLLKIGCDGHTNYRSHQRCDRSHRLFRVTLTPIPPFALLRNRVQPLF